MQRSALRRSRRELSNAYFLAKFRFDTAENEPSKVCPTDRRLRALLCRLYRLYCEVRGERRRALVCVHGAVDVLRCAGVLQRGKRLCEAQRSSLECELVFSLRDLLSGQSWRRLLRSNSGSGAPRSTSPSSPPTPRSQLRRPAAETARGHLIGLNSTSSERNSDF